MKKVFRLLLLSTLLVIAGTLISAGPFSVRSAYAQNSVVVARGVQTGTVVFGNNGGTQEGTTTAAVTLGTAVDATKAFVKCHFSTAQGGPNVHPTCELTNTTVTITIGATVAASAHTTVRWYVAEFEGAVTVQRGLVTFNAGASEPGGALVTLGTAVDCAKSFVLTSERMNTTTTTLDEQWQASATLTASGGSAPRAACTSGSTSSLELFRNESTTALTVAWQVVQIEGITVQRGLACISNGTPTCALAGSPSTGLTAGQSQGVNLSPAITTSKAWVLTTQRAGTAVAGQDGLYTARANFSCDGSTTSGSCLRFDRGSAGGSNTQLQITWEVISLNDTGRVERNAWGSPLSTGNNNNATGVTTASFSSTVYQARTVPFYSRFNDRINNAGDQNSVNLAVQVNQSNLTFTRNGGGNRTETVDWQAVEFFGCATDPTLCHVSVSALSGTTTDSASVRISWWPVLYAAGNQCFAVTTSVPVSPSTCNVMVVRATFAAGQTASDITFSPTPGASYPAGALTGTGSCTPAAGPAGGSVSIPCVVHDGVLTSGAVATFATDCWSSGSPCGAPNLKNDGTTYVYKVYVRSGAPAICGTPPCWTTLATSLSQVSVTPKIRNGPNGSGLQWVYQPSGGAVLNSPIADTNNRLYASSSNNKILTIDTSTGAELSLPLVTPAKVSGYPSWWPLNPAGTQVVVGDEFGYVTSFDGATGKRLWTRRIHTDPEDSTKGNILAAVVVQTRNFSNDAFKNNYSNNYGYSGDVIFAATRNLTPGTGPTANQNKRNKVYALRATDGTSLWTFDPNNAGGDCNPQQAMDIINGTPWVDYDRNSLYVASEDGPTAGQSSMWILDTLGPTTPGPATSDCRGTLKALFGAILDNDFTIWQSYDAKTFYFQTLNGFLRAYDADSQSPRIGGSSVISSVVTGSPGFLIKGSVWQDYNKYLQGLSRFYFVLTNGGVWCVNDNGNNFSRCSAGEWPTNPIYQHSAGANGVAAGATPLASGMLLEPHFWAGGGDNLGDQFGLGTIFQLSTTNGAREKTFALDSTVLGDMSVAAAANALFVGSLAGRIYRINLDADFVCYPCVYGSLP